MRGQRQWPLKHFSKTAFKALRLFGARLAIAQVGQNEAAWALREGLPPRNAGRET